MQKLRKILQFIFLAPLFIVPVLNLLEIYFIKGTYISLDIGGLSISDPVAVLQALFISHSVRPIMLASVAIPAIIVIFFGRVWCSWACPYYLMLDGFEKLRKKLKLKPLKPKYKPEIKRKANISRLGVFITGLIIVGILGIPLMYLISPPSIISSQAVLLIKYTYITAEFILLPVLVIIEFVFGYRIWCRYVCPTGTCLSLMQSKFSIHVEYSGDCSKCQKCVQVCPMILDPKTDSLSSACNNCGECISACPDNKKRPTLYFKSH